MMGAGRVWRHAPVLAGLVLAALVGSPALAQDDSGTRTVLELQQLREEVRELRGMVEAQQREIEGLRQRQRDQYLDLDRRLGGAGASAAPVESPAGSTERAVDPVQTGPAVSVDLPLPRQDLPDVRPPIEAAPEISPLAAPESRATRELAVPGPEEQQHYDRAFRALRETRYADAAEGFDEFLGKYPDSSYAPNAQYWLGEVYYVTRDFETALTQFNALLRDYPDSAKQGDALLKIGFSHYELRQYPQARAALEQVISDYPGTTIARLAENRLRSMRLEGHY